MTVDDLIAALFCFSADTEVQVMDSEWGAEPIAAIEYRNGRIVISP